MSTFELKFPIKITKKGESRGQLNSEEIIEAICGDWEELTKELGKFGADEREQLKDHFNSLLDNHDNLGEALCGDLDDFKLIISELNSDQKEILTNELVRVEIFDPDV